MPTLDWIGKKAVENHHNEIPFRLLKSIPELSVGEPDSGNLIIQGDNLHALKALLPYYAGQVKCICIDPPYNTGKEYWKYNDNVNSPEIITWLNKVVGKEEDDLSRHDKWLCMMYPRLKLLRKFLSDDGLIFINIDDNEIHNLLTITDEIFLEKNRLSILVWDLGTGTTAGHFTRAHEYILVYAKNKFILDNFNNFNQNEIINHGALKKPSRANPYSQITFPEGIEYEGTSAIFQGEIGGSEKIRILSDKMIFENGKLKYPVVLEAGWAMRNQILSWLDKKETFDSKGQKVLRFYFNKNGILWYTKEKAVLNPQSIIKNVGSTKNGSTILEEILGTKKFDFPKSIDLMKYLLQLTSNKDSLILDSFSGSGTTGHAVLQLNKEDGGNRKFILVEMEEKICKEITAERIKRVINGYEYTKSNGDIEKVEGLGGGFRYCSLDEPLFDELGNINKNVKYKELASHVFFSETGIPMPEGQEKFFPQIGTYNNTCYYLLFNGILGDKSINGGNILTKKMLESLPEFDGKKVVFAAGSRINPLKLQKENIFFKQTPYELKIS